MKLSDDETLFLLVAGEWLFYSNLSDGEKLYRVRADGTCCSKVSDDRVGYLNYDRRYIYYTNTAERHALYRVLPEGGEKSKVMEGGKAAGLVGIAGRQDLLSGTVPGYKIRRSTVLMHLRA